MTIKQIISTADIIKDPYKQVISESVKGRGGY